MSTEAGSKVQQMYIGTSGCSILKSCNRVPREYKFVLFGLEKEMCQEGGKATVGARIKVAIIGKSVSG